MNNYEYLISSLPDLTRDRKGLDGSSADAIITWLRDGCSERDRRLIDFLLKGWDDSSLGEGFYRSAAAGGNGFLRDYFRFDLNVRNAKVRYLNKALGRPQDTDIFLDEEDDTFDLQRVNSVLESGDILTRERGLDDLMWDKIDELTVRHYFDIETILGFIARLHIADRWLKLDAESGRRMFARLVESVRGSYTGIQEAADAAVK